MFKRPELEHAPRLGEIMSPERNSFGFMRLAMALVVLVSHSFMFLAGSADGEPLTALTGRSLGEYGVQVFFILSGLMVAQSFDRSRSVLDFAAARGLRIFPALAVCVLLTALVLGPIVSVLPVIAYFSSPELAAYIAKTLSLSTGSAPLPGVFDANPMANRVNTSLWTLKYEVICYIALAIAGSLGLFNARWRTFAATGVAIFIAVAFYAPPADQEAYTSFDTIRYFAVFFATGVLAYLIRDRLVVTGYAVLPLLVVFAATRGTDIAELGSAISLGYTALWAATKSFGPLRAFCNKSDLSYGVYIFAGPIQQALIDAVPAISPLTLTVTTLVVVLPMAWLSWTFIEKPALSLRRSITGLRSRLGGLSPRAISR